MQIPEIFSCVKTEHSLATQAVYDFFYLLFFLHFAFTCTFTFNT